jgi:DNA polymerase I-like protein with 3'-5' exonuclease and polymerase domains
MSATTDQKKNYIHFVSPVKVVPEWHKYYTFVLVESMEHLKQIFAEISLEKLMMSFDTETSSLDPEEGFIVGYSFCLDGKTAYYVAVNHYHTEFNLYEESIDFIYEMMCLAKKVILFNVKFDFRFMEYHSYSKSIHEFLRFKYIRYDMSKVNYYDVSVPCWLSDTNVKMPSLKMSALHFLGYKMQTYAEVSEGVENFYYINPKECFQYGGSDALCTYLLVPATMKYYKESGFSGEIDIRVMYPLMHYEQEKVYLEDSILAGLVTECNIKLESLEKEIYQEVGYHFKLNSPAQVSDAFSRLGIDTGSRTKTGYMCTGIEELMSLPPEIKNQHPALSKFVDYKVLFKFQSSYAKVLHEISKGKGYLRCNYKMQQVPTGRLASGKDLKNTFFSEINVQSIPKPHPQFYYVLDLGDRSINIKKDNTIMGYKFSPVQYVKNPQTGKKEPIDGKTLFGNCIGVSEGMSQEQNARSAFLPVLNKESIENEWIWVGIDFSGQELRLAANFSREPAWIEAFQSGGDIHKNTAYSVWGKENYDKEKRKMAKAANFSIIYGAGDVSFVGEGKTEERPQGMNLTEAEKFYADYKKGLPALFAYQDRLIRQCRQSGSVYTFFGRPRRVKFYFQNRQNGFGKRTILNDPIQGTAGDVLKIVMCKVWKTILNSDEYKDDVMFKITVHDEINYGIRVSRLTDITRKLEKAMTFNVVEWAVPLTVEVSVGWSWGGQFTFVWNQELKEYIPKIEG